MSLAFKLAWQNSELEILFFSTRQGVHLSIHSRGTSTQNNKKKISGAYYKVSWTTCSEVILNCVADRSPSFALHFCVGLNQISK